MMRTQIHVINSLGTGGAERTLSALVKQGYGNKVIVFVLVSKGNTESECNLLRGLGAEVHNMAIMGLPSYCRQLIYFANFLGRQQSECILIAWLHHSWIFASISAVYAMLRQNGLKDRLQVVFNIRSSPPPFKLRFQILKEWVIFKVCMGLSWLMSPKYITCSNEAYREHLQHMFKPGPLIVIENGIDYSNIYFIPNAKVLACKEYNLEEGGTIIGWMGRAESQKNLKGLARLVATYMSTSEERCIFLAVGRGVTHNRYLLSLREYFPDRVILREETKNPAFWLSVIDIFISLSNYGEAYPNTVAEAIVCGCYSLALDVGSTRHIVGEHGTVLRRDSSVIDLTKTLRRVVKTAKSQRGNRSTRYVFPSKKDALSAYSTLIFSEECSLP